MQYYDRIDVSERIAVNKRSKSKECHICHYWHLLYEGFTFQLHAWKRCHDLLQISINP